jgi:hypothetical protein
MAGMGFSPGRRLEMSETFTDFLNEIQGDPDMIQQALRIHLSESTNDLTHKEMLTELRENVSSAQELDRLLKHLEHDPDALEQAALIYFERAWENDAQQPLVRAAFKHAKGRLPVVEVVVLAIVAMYGMHLIATKGVTDRRMVERTSEGKYREITEKREPFAPIASAFALLLGKKG